MDKEKFIKITRKYLFSDIKDLYGEEKIDNYTIYIRLDKNQLNIRVLNNETNKNVDLGSKKYKSYINHILEVSKDYKKDDKNHIFTLRQENTTEDNTINNTEIENEDVDYELTYMLNGYEFTKTFRARVTMNIFVGTIKNDTYKELSIKKVPKRNDTTEITTKNNMLSDTDIEILKKLISNYDKIMDLADNTINTTNKKIDLSSKSTKVTSIRLNKEIHESIRAKAEEEQINIGELINKALYEYLNK